MPVRDRKGNVWSDDEKIVEPSPVGAVDDLSFYCIECKAVRAVRDGVTASYELGGWLCNSHLQDK